MNRKGLFHVLLVITMLWGGMGAVSGLVVAAVHPYVQTLFADNPGMMPEEAYTMMQSMLDLPRAYFLVTGLLYLLEVAGAVLMWNLRWSGFHCYTLARLLLLLVPILFIGRGFVGFGDVMFAVLYISLYFLLLKRVTAGDGEATSTADDSTGDGSLQQ